MAKLNINYESECEYIDCKDKLLLMKVPSHIMMKEFDKLLEVADSIKEDGYAKNIIIISDDIKFESMNKEQAITMINDYINELQCIKERIQEGYGDGDE